MTENKNLNKDKDQHQGDADETQQKNSKDWVFKPNPNKTKHDFHNKENLTFLHFE